MVSLDQGRRHVLKVSFDEWLVYRAYCDSYYEPCPTPEWERLRYESLRCREELVWGYRDIHSLSYVQELGDGVLSACANDAYAIDCRYGFIGNRAQAAISYCLAYHVEILFKRLVVSSRKVAVDLFVAHCAKSACASDQIGPLERCMVAEWLTPGGLAGGVQDRIYHLSRDEFVSLVDRRITSRQTFSQLLAAV